MSENFSMEIEFFPEVNKAATDEAMSQLEAYFDKLGDDIDISTAVERDLRKIETTVKNSVGHIVRQYKGEVNQTELLNDLQSRLEELNIFTGGQIEAIRQAASRGINAVLNEYRKLNREIEANYNETYKIQKAIDNLNADSAKAEFEKMNAAAQESTDSLNNLLATMKQLADKKESNKGLFDDIYGKAPSKEVITGIDETVKYIEKEEEALKKAREAQEEYNSAQIDKQAQAQWKDENFSGKSAREAADAFIQIEKEEEQAAERAAQEVKNKFQDAVTAMLNYNDRVKAEFKADANEAANATLRTINKEEQAAKDASKAATEAARKQALQWAKVGTGVYTLIRAFKSLEQAVKKAFTVIVNGTKTAIKAFATLTTSVTKMAVTLSGLPIVFKGIFGAVSGIANSIKSTISGISFTNLLKESSELASSLHETQNRVEQVFGTEGASLINKFSETAITSLGMATLTARDFAASFGAALRSTGQSADNIQQMSIGLTKLSADLASFYDIEQDVAKEKLFSGVISGQIKAMRQLGVDMTVASLKAYALQQGYSKLYTEMTAAEKQAVRYRYAMDKLDYVHGDYARTINSTANQLRLLKNQFKELGTIIGSIINKFIQPLLIWLNAVASKVLEVAKVIAGVMGIDWTLGAGSGSAALPEVTDEYDDMAESAEAVADAEENATDNLHKLSKAAKGALAPFHKLNVLQNKTAKDAEKSGTIDVGGIIEPNVDTGIFSLKKAFKDLLDWLWGLDWEGALSKLTSAINKLVKKLPGLIRELFNELKKWVLRISDLINQFVDEIDWTGIGNVIKEVIYGLGQNILAALKEIKFDNIGKALAEVFNSIIDDPTVFITWGAVVGTAIQDGFNFIEGVIKNLHWKQLGDDLYYFLKGAFDSIDGPRIRKTITDGLKSISDTLKTFFSDLVHDDDLMTDMADDLLSVINGVADYLASADYKELLDGAVEGITKFLGKIADNLENNDTLSKIASGIVDLFEAVGKILKSEEFKRLAEDVWKAIKQAIYDFFTSEDIPVPVKFAAGIFALEQTGIFDAIKGIGEFVIALKLLGDNIGILSKLGGAFKTAFEAVKDFSVLFRAAEGAEKLTVALEPLGKLMTTLTKGVGGFISGLLLLVGTAAGTVEDFNKLADASHNLNEASSRFYQNLNNDAMKVKDTFESIVSTDYEHKMADFSDALGKSFLFDGLKSTEGEAAANIYKYLTNVLGYGREEAAKQARDIADTINGNLNNVGDLTEAQRKLVEGYNDFFAKGLEQNQEFADRFKEIATQMSDAAGESSSTSWEQINTLYENIKAGSMTVADLQQMDNRIVADAATQANKEILDSYNYTYEQIEEASKRAADIERTGVDTVRLTRNESLDEYKEKMTEHLGYLEGAYNEYINKRKEMEANGRAEELTAEQQHQAAIAALKHDGYSQEEADRAANAARAKEYTSEIENANADAAKRSTESWKDEAQNLGGALGDLIEAFTSEMAGDDGEGVIAKVMTTGMDELPDKVSTALEPVKNTIKETVESIGTEEDGGAFKGIVNSANTLADDITPGVEAASTSVSEQLASIGAEENAFSGILTSAEEVGEKLNGEEGIFPSVYTAITTQWGELASWFDENVWTPMTTSLEDINTKIKEVFIDQVETIKTNWEDLVKAVQDASSAMVDALDAAAEAASNLAAELEAAASAASGASSSSYNRGYPSSVQGYANGGVFLPNRPQLALLGDNRSQTEYALTTGHLQQIASMMAGAIGSGSGGVGDITIPIYLGDELLDTRMITAGQMHSYRSNGR